MLYIVRDIVFILLAIIGIADVARIVILFFLHSKQDKTVALVVPIEEHTEDIEHLLRSTAAKISFMGRNRWEKVICLDCGADAETKTICKKICTEFPYMEFLPKEALPNLFPVKSA